MKASQEAIDSLGLNILNRGFIRASDMIELQTAMRNELSRRNLTIPVNLLDIVNPPPMAGIRVLSRHLKRVYEQAVVVDPAQDWISRADVGRIIAKDDIDECIFYLKALMAQDIPDMSNRAILRNGYMEGSGAYARMIQGSGTYGSYVEVSAYDSQYSNYGKAQASVVTDRKVDLTNVSQVKFNHFAWGDYSNRSQVMCAIHTESNRPYTYLSAGMSATTGSTALQTTNVDVSWMSGSYYLAAHVIVDGYVQKGIKLIDILLDDKTVWSATQGTAFTS